MPDGSRSAVGGQFGNNGNRGTTETRRRTRNGRYRRRASRYRMNPNSDGVCRLVGAGLLVVGRAAGRGVRRTNLRARCVRGSKSACRNVWQLWHEHGARPNRDETSGGWIASKWGTHQYITSHDLYLLASQRSRASGVAEYNGVGQSPVCAGNPLGGDTTVLVPRIDGADAPTLHNSRSFGTVYQHYQHGNDNNWKHNVSYRSGQIFPPSRIHLSMHTLQKWSWQTTTVVVENLN